MKFSMIDHRLKLTEEQWVVSLVNTADTDNLKERLGGHAKIIIEGIEHGEFFLGEYHIFEVPTDAPLTFFQRATTYLPYCMQNIPHAYRVIVKEFRKESDIPRKKVAEHRQINAQKNYLSWEISKTSTMQMVRVIKQEKADIEREFRPTQSLLQHFGPHSIFSVRHSEQTETGVSSKPYITHHHNCITWTKERLELAGIENARSLLEYKKAVPYFQIGSWK